MGRKFNITKADLTAILYEFDPMDLNFAPKDEYELEAELIITELSDCDTLEEIYNLLVKVFIQMFDETSVEGNPSQRLHLAAKILFDNEIFDYVMASIISRKEMKWYVERLNAQARENGHSVTFPKPDNYNVGIDSAASLVEHNPQWFEGENAHKKVAEAIRKLTE